MRRFALGLDYGTNSVRALLVDVLNGDEVATSIYDFPSGESGVLLDPSDPHLARQNPGDYISGLTAMVRAVMAGVDANAVVGIGVDTTGSSPLPVDEHCVPLAMLPAWRDNLDAHCWLWKDHTSFAEAAEITEKANGLPYLYKCGGTYSSEWFWSKVLRCARVAPEVFSAAHSWVECCDWITGYLTGCTDPALLPRSVCAAGHKAMYSDDWGGLPSEEFLNKLDPRLGLLRSRLYASAHPSNECAGLLCEKVAREIGLRAGIPVAVGAFDAHFGAVASGIKPGTLVKIMGTSTCDCMVHPISEPLEDIPGLCGIVKGSILPGYYGLEAGQSAVGDIFNWVSRFTGNSHAELTRQAASLRPGESGLLALDWLNGNRTVLVDPLLSGMIVGLNLHTTPGAVYRAAIEATAFGALKIIERLEEYSVKVSEVVACGGIAEKSPLVMQIYADVTGRVIKVSRSGQTCALGAAIFGSVVGGAYEDVADAQAAMTGTKEEVYVPNVSAQRLYAGLYLLYTSLHDAFGTAHWSGGLNGVMKELLQIQNEVRSA